MIKGRKQPKTLWSRIFNREAFSFTVPLPEPSDSTFYSMPNDGPCLRGGPFNRDSSIKVSELGSRGWDRSVAVGAKQLEGFSSKTKSSSKENRDQWNKRTKQLEFPPWLPFESGIDGSKKSDPSSTLKDSLTTFVQDKSGGSKWLLGPRTIYGWNTKLIASELKPFVEELNVEMNGSKETPVSHLHFEVQSPSPFFALNYYSDVTSIRSKLSRRLPALDRTLLPISHIVNAVPYLVLGFLGKDDIGLLWMIPPIISLLILVVVLTQLIWLSPSIHTSIGLAYKMTGWRKINFSSAMEEEQIVEVLRRQDQDGLKGTPKVKLEEDGWYRLNGIGEREWVRVHRERFREAIISKRKDDLTSDWPV